ncbi:hypothetical protein ACQKMI_11980 [Lysinibacillus sp. NPDC097214]|uniref:hypothetical protein n=1 Tax=Lysinibacillus sp. NPDC097214 TaxID=3390584 RepID=UPI003D05A961
MTYSNSLIFSINPINAAVERTVGGVVAYRKLGESKMSDWKRIGLVSDLGN